MGWSILGGFVTLLTLGICAPFAMCWLYSWEAKHTVLDGRRLEFTGTAGGLFGTWIVCLLLTIITVGIYSLWIPIRIRKWREANTFFEDEIQTYDAEQKLRDEKASYFDGGFLQWLGWSILGCLVTIITLGIYSLWISLRIQRWKVSHTHLLSVETL